MRAGLVGEPPLSGIDARALSFYGKMIPGIPERKHPHSKGQGSRGILDQRILASEGIVNHRSNHHQRSSPNPSKGIELTASRMAALSRPSAEEQEKEKAAARAKREARDPFENPNPNPNLNPNWMIEILSRILTLTSTLTLIGGSRSFRES